MGVGRLLVVGLAWALASTLAVQPAGGAAGAGATARTPVEGMGFDLAVGTGSTDPQAVWSDDTTMWVADGRGDKIYAYTLSTKERDEGKDFDTLKAAGNRDPRGMWSDGATMWVSDWIDEKIYAYNLSTKERDAGKDFNTLKAAGNRHNTGIWSDDTTMWVVDSSDEKIYAYNLSTKERDEGNDFELMLTERFVGAVQGLWSDGTTMWVVDDSDEKILAYNLSSKERDEGKDLTVEVDGTLHLNGIWSDGTTMWVSEGRGEKIYAYNLISRERDAGKDFNTLNDTNEDPVGLWSDGTTMWVTDLSANKIFAYDLSTKARDADEDFNTLPAWAAFPGGVWSNGATMWVTEASADKIFAYDLSTKARDAGKDFNTLKDAGNRNPLGLWSDGTTMWVVDGVDGNIYAYNLSTKARDASKDFETSSVGQPDPLGIWGNRDFVWVSGTPVEAGLDRAFAYDLTSRQRVPSRDLTIEGAGALAGLWGSIPDDTMPDKGTIWAVDTSSNRVHAAVLPVPPGEPGSVTVAPGNGTLTVEWTATDTAGSSDIVGYDVRYRRKGRAEPWTTVDRSSPTALVETVSRLENETPYEVQVSAVNSEVNGPWAATESTPSQDPPTPAAPGAPGSVTVTPGNRTLTVEWTRPATGTVTSYDLRHRAVIASVPGEWVQQDGVTSPHTLDVINLTHYDVQVRAVNSAGGGHWATASGAGALRLHADNNRPTALWSDGDRLWVADDGRYIYDEDKIFKYSVATGQYEDTIDPLDADNSAPQGLWSDGDTLWVLDWRDGHIYAYNLDTKARDEGKEFDVRAPVASLRDIWSDGDTMWVIDWYNSVVRAYDMETKRRKPSEDFYGLSYRSPEGMWSDGITMWISSSRSTDPVAAYDLKTKDRFRPSDVTVTFSGQGTLVNLWSDGETLWALEGGPEATSRRIRQVATPLNGRLDRPENLGVTSGDGQLTLAWGASRGSGLSGYEVQWRNDEDQDPANVWATVTRSSSTELTETVLNLTNGDYYEMRVRAVGHSGLASAWALAYGTPTPASAPGSPAILELSGASETIDEGGEDRALYVVWSWVSGAADYEVRYRQHEPDRGAWITGTANIAVDAPTTSARITGLTPGRRYQVQVRAVGSADDAGPWATEGNRAGRGFYNLDPDNSDPRGIWSDGATMWVSDWENPKLFAYDMETKERDGVKDFNSFRPPSLFSVDHNLYPGGVWSDGTTRMWVAFTGEVWLRPGKVFAYDFDTTDYEPTPFSSRGSDAPLYVSGNGTARGIWSDGSTLWVSDSSDRKVYAYAIADGSRDRDKEFDSLVDPSDEDDFDKSQVTPTGIWSDNATMWIADAGTNRIYAYNMSTKLRDRSRDIPAHDHLRSPEALNPSFGRDPYGLWGDGTTLWVLDDSLDRIVPVVLPDPPDEPTRVVATFGDEELTVDWRAPVDSGSSEVESYGVRYRKQGVDAWTLVERENPASTTEQLRPLVNGFIHDVQVRAVNAETISEWVEVVGEPRSAPGRPGRLRATPGNRELVVTWDEPADDGGRRRHRYNVQHCDSSTDDCGPDSVYWSISRSVASDSTETTVDNLNNDTTYEVRVQAVNDVGGGDWAETSATPKAVPVAPTGVTVTRRHRSLAVVWITLSADVTRYDVRYRETGSPGWSSRSATVEQATIRGLHNGTSYEVQVRAHNSVGEGGWSAIAMGTPATNPGLPRNLEASPGSQSLTVTWDEPADDGGDSIDRYDVQYRLGTGSWMNYGSVSRAPWESTISGLENGTRYEVQVRAHNSVGDGGWSLARGTPSSVPDALRDLDVSASGTTSGGGELLATWSAPSDNGQTIDSYQVEYRGTSSQSSWRSAGTVDAAGPLRSTIDGLENGTSYDVRVRAHNSDGHGPWATGSDTPESVPGLPSNLSVSPQAVSSVGGTLAVSWLEPTEDGGRSIDRYDVEYRGTSSQNSWSSAGTVDAGDPLESAIDGLDNGTSYDVRVSAHNRVGNGGWESASAKPYRVPDEPGMVVAAPRNRGLTVTWDEPADDGGDRVSSYDVEYRAESAGSWRPVRSASSPEASIGSLTNGDTYLVRVRARNVAGPGPWAQTTATPIGPPDAPDDLAVRQGEEPGQLVVAWSPPENLPSGSTYEVEYRQSGSSAPWTPVEPPEDFLSVTIDGLIGGRLYDVRVRAVSAVGGAGPWRRTSGTPDTAPGLSVGGMAVREDAGPAVFEVVLSEPLRRAVTVSYRTVDGTDAGDAIAGDDYVPVADGTLTIELGEMSATFEVEIVDDDDEEPAETFEVTVDVSGPHVDVVVGSAVATILDDDTRMVDAGPIGGPPGGGPPSGGPPSGGAGPGEEPEAEARAGFVDVDPSGVHAATIDALFAAGITAGCSTEPLEFCPDEDVTRARMATFLARALDLEPPETSAGFVDVDPSGVHAAAIDALFAAGIAAGCSTEPLEFCPDDTLNRAQMATFLARALDLEPPETSAGFVDVDPSGVHAAAIDALFAAGITAGCSTEPLEFCPDDTLNRAQMATFLARALDLADPPATQLISSR